MAGAARARPLAVGLLCAYAAGIIGFAAAVPDLRAIVTRERLRDAAAIGLSVGGAAAAVLGLLSLRRRPLAKLPGLVLTAAVALAAFRFAPNVLEGPDRLFEQTHLLQYGLLALAYTVVFRRRFPDASLYTTGLAACLAVALVDEALQWWIPGRVGGLEDVRLDLAAAAIGLALSALVVHLGRVPLVLGRQGLVATLRAGALLVLLFAAFIDLVHLGHAFPIGDGAIVLRSRFPAGRVRELSRSWTPRAEPSGAWPRIVHGEDFYRAEALWHTERRNNLRAQHDESGAEVEEAVLQACFRSFLEATPAARLGAPAATPPPEPPALARAEAAISGPPQVVTWIDRFTLWLAALAAAAAAAAFAAELVSLYRFAAADEAGR